MQGPRGLVTLKHGDVTLTGIYIWLLNFPADRSMASCSCQFFIPLICPRRFEGHMPVRVHRAPAVVHQEPVRCGHAGARVHRAVAAGGGAELRRAELRSGVPPRVRPAAARVAGLRCFRRRRGGAGGPPPRRRRGERGPAAARAGRVRRRARQDRVPRRRRVHAGGPVPPPERALLGVHGDGQGAAGVLRERGALVRRHVGTPGVEAGGQRAGPDRALPCRRVGRGPVRLPHVLRRLNFPRAFVTTSSVIYMHVLLICLSAEVCCKKFNLPL
jgi:hypothetical protein